MISNMPQRISTLLILALLGLAQLAAALPTVSDEPTRTLNPRGAGANNMADTVLAAAEMSNAKTQGFGSDGQCSLTQAKMPTVSASSTSLPSPTGTLAYVAIGRGTQNYTCDPSKPTASPSAIGAVANLYDASCVASKYSFLLGLLPSIALQFPAPELEASSFVAMNLLGHHYFTDPNSPTFNLDTANGNAGYVNVQSGSKVPAPSGAPVGVNNQGFGAVPWLSLSQKSGNQGASGQQTFKEVYRVNTAGGNPPSTCQNMPASFEVQYAAEYWFFK